MSAYEVESEPPLLIHETVLAELRIKARFAKARDALNASDGVFIKDIVVAEPQLKREIAANRDEAMEIHVVAKGPGETAKNCGGKRDCDQFKRRLRSARLAQPEPK